MTWQLQEAKNKLSRLITDSQSKGPQFISRLVVRTAVIISYAEYQRLVRPRRTFKDFVQDYKGSEMPKFVRDRNSTGRATPIDFNNGKI